MPINLKLTEINSYDGPPIVSSFAQSVTFIAFLVPLREAMPSGRLHPAAGHQRAAIDTLHAIPSNVTGQIQLLKRRAMLGLRGRPVL